MHLLRRARALVWRHKTRVNGASARVSRLHKGAKVEHQGALKGKMLSAAAMGYERTEKLGRFFVAVFFPLAGIDNIFYLVLHPSSARIFYNSF